MLSQENRNKKLKQVFIYVKTKIENGIYPSYKELNKKFNISTYKITLGDIYPALGINILKSNIRKTKNCREIIKNELIYYIKEQVKKGHYPTRRFIENKFKFKLDPLFASIKDLYSKAKIQYKQENSQELKNKKARILTRIVISILPKLNLKLITVRGTHNKGIDILTKNNKGELVGIEIKAHNKYEPIKKRNFEQLKRFKKQEKLNKIILITTSSRFEKYPKISNLEIIGHNKLKELCTADQSLRLEYIRNSSVHIESKEKQIKKQLILDYTKKILNAGEDISYSKILEELNLDIYTYFSKLNDIYIEAGVTPPLRKIGGRRCHSEAKKEYFEFVVDKIIEYMKEEITKGHYPTGLELGRKFKMKHIWNFITMTELYQRIGIKPYHERKPRFRVE